MIVWKTTYNDYVIAYPNSSFHENTLMDQLQNALEDIKIDTINKKGTRKVVLQSNQVMAQLKGINNHATRNVLKWK